MKPPTDNTTAPEDLTEEQENAQELLELGRKIRDWQTVQRPALSDNKLLDRYPGLGSTKTFQRVLKDDLAELNLEKQLAAYRSVWEQINEEAPLLESEVYLETLGTVNKARLAALEARAAKGNTRFVLIEGDTGCGKTKALEGIARKYKETIMIEASAAWKDKPSAFLTDLSVALGGTDDPTVSQARRLREVVAILKRQRRIICIDEGHEMGPQCLNTLRSLINQSECVFVVAAMHTLWERLENKGAYEEAAQLTGNRLQRRVRLHRVNTVDAARLIQSLTGMQGDPESKEKDNPLSLAASMLIKDCARNGNLKFIARCAATAKRLAGDDQVTLAHIATAKTDELSRR